MINNCTIILACFIFECANSLGDNIILSIGQAFELKYKAFLQSHPKIQPVVGRLEIT